MARNDNKTYRDTRRCATCHWVDFKIYGASGSGHYCTKYDHRCCKTKVCDSHITEEEFESIEGYESLRQWKMVMEGFKL